MMPLREYVDTFTEILSYCGDRLRMLWYTNRARVVLCALALMPVLIVGSTTLVSAVLLIGPGGRVNNWYLQQATLSLINKEYDTARLCYSGLLQREPDNKQYQFGLALALFGMGEDNAALILTRRLAPEGANGYAPAHVFVAEQLLAAADPSADDLRSAEWHLLRAYQIDHGDQRTNALLSAIYARTNRWEQLKQHLPLAGEAVDEIGLLAAQSFAAQGDFAEAEAWAKRAARFFRNRCLADPSDAASRLKWAEASLMLREFAMALETLESGWRDFQDPAFRHAAAQVCLAWSRTAALTPTRRIAVLQRGLEFDALNPGLLMQLTDVATLQAALSSTATTQVTEGAAVRALCLAIAAAIDANPDELRQQLSAVLEMAGPEAPVVIANIATLWGFSDHPNATSALNLTETFVQLLPDSPFARRANGLVLSRQMRWNRASVFLESFLELVPDDIAVRSQLAACYEQMSMPTEAAAHRAIITATTQPTTPAASPQ